MNIKTIIPINGMYCASCAMTIENTLQKTEGVSEAKVNIATEKAVVEYDSSEISLEEFREKRGTRSRDLKTPFLW